MKIERDGGWRNLTAEQRQRRIEVSTRKRMATIKKNRREKALTAKQGTSVVLSVPKPVKAPPRRIRVEMPAPTHNGSGFEYLEAGSTTDSQFELLGKLIVATFKALTK